MIKRIGLFFTWDVSLKLWKDRGLLEREIQLYKRLSNEGFEIIFFTWGGKEDLEIAKTITPIKVVPLYIRLPCPKFKPFRAVYSLLTPWVLRKELKEISILKTNQMWGSWYAVFSKVFFKKPLIVRTGFELYHFTLEQNHALPRRIFIWLISFLAYHYADVIFMATREDRDFIVKHFKIKPERIKIRPNWIDVDFFAPDLSIQKKNHHLLFVGRLSEQKNLGMFIDAIAETPYSLDIIGDGELRERLEQYAKNKGVRVNFLGNVPNDKLPEYYNRYPVFVLPSHFEGNPKTLLEAMACGCAVLGSDVHGIRSIINHEETGFLCAPTMASLKTGVERLMNDKSLRQKLGEAARIQIVQNQSLDFITAQECNSYENLLELKQEET